MILAKLNPLALIALSFGCLTTVSATAFSETFRVRLAHIPPVANTQCDDFAYAEGQRFRDFIGAGVTVTDARCVASEISSDYPYWNVHITYESNAEVQMVSTFDEVAISHPGILKREACEAQLKDESAKFTRLTQLKVFSAYCRSPNYREEAWEPVVVGFGNTAVKSFTVSVDIHGTVVGHTKDSFTNMIRQGLIKLGAELGQITTDGRFAYSTLAFSYYGKERFRVDNKRLAIFSTKEACSKEIGAATQGLAQAAVTHIGVYCSAVYSDEIELIAMKDSRSKLTLSESSIIYETFDSCESQKAATVEHYRKDLHRDITVGFCTVPKEPFTVNGVKNKFKIVMIEKR